MKVDILRNEKIIAHLDNLSGNYVLDNFGVDSDCIWGISVKNRVIGYCTLAYAEGVIPNVGYNDLLLSDVYILPEFRGRGYITQFLKLVIKQVNAPIYAEILHPQLVRVYHPLGFRLISNGLLYRPL